MTGQTKGENKQMSIAFYPTILTPFTADNQIDYESLDRLIEYLFRNHSDGLFAVCQSSEMFFLSDQEKLTLADHCIDRCHRAKKKCVVSGHTHEHIEEQMIYLQKLEKLSPDAIILVTNRLASETESDDVLIANLQKIISQLNAETRLGLYECPHPYKRLLSEKVIDYVVKTGRFDFIKDTSCQIDIIRARLDQIASSTVKLYNANAATLMESLAAGAAGYSGVMLNFIPELFSLIKRYLNKAQAIDVMPPLQYHVRSAGSIAEFVTMASVFEYQKYPVNAKHYLKLKGIFENTKTRSVESDTLNESQIKELISLANRVEKTRCRVDVFNNRQLLFEEGKFFRNCHASTVLVLDDGTVLVAYFAGHAEGANDVGIWLSRRVNGVWQDPVCIAKNDDLPHWNPVLFKIGQKIRLVYKVGQKVHCWKSRTIISVDQGAGWSAEKCYPSPDDACGPVRSKPITLASGMLLAPNSEETLTQWRPRVDISTDGGDSFQLLAYIPINTSDAQAAHYISGAGAIQPALWESQPGHVHMLLRTSCGYIFRSDSNDNGKTWCQAYNTFLPNNNSGIEIAQDRSDLYLILNPISGNWSSRNPITIMRSTDNGKTFTHFTTLDFSETDPQLQIDAEYSYPAAVVMNNRLYVTYTYLRRQIAYCEIELGAQQVPGT